jgi:hypothetical protein
LKNNTTTLFKEQYKQFTKETFEKPWWVTYLLTSKTGRGRFSCWCFLLVYVNN